MASVEIMFLGINLVFISGYVFLNLEISEFKLQWAFNGLLENGRIFHLL
jgi:hypothetical protein